MLGRISHGAGYGVGLLAERGLGDDVIRDHQRSPAGLVGKEDPSSRLDMADPNRDWRYDGVQLRVRAHYG